MSGITGIITAVPTTISQATLQAMSNSLAHRGPDAEGIFIAPHVALGYRHFDVYKLSVAQSETILYLDRYVVVFDGRIYNLPELQEDLRGYGYTFDCPSEAQLLAAAYDKWGVECLQKLNADWAFVLYDTEAHLYFIARDRFGIKPLYYYADDEKFIFGSEVKAIYASQQISKEPNEAFFKAYLENGPNEYDTRTAFANVLRFPFGHYFVGTHQQLLMARGFTRYWDLSVNTSNETYCPNKAKQITQKYYDLLADAVRIRMRGKVKVGAALSGGLDSSSIVYLMNKELERQRSGARVQTFSCVYSAPGTEDCDESQFINIVAKALDVDSNQIEPEARDVPGIVELSVYANETLSDGLGVSNYSVAAKAKEFSCKVILNGQGADETLAGYSFFILDYLSDLSFIDFAKQVKMCKMHINKNRIAMLWLYKILQLCFGLKLSSKIISIVSSKEKIGHLNKKLDASVRSGLVNLLHYAEHIPMALSVETRTPFMDHRLIEYLASIPGSYKIRDGWTKHIARKAFEGKLPDVIIWRKDKMGWPAPLAFWFENELKTWVNKFATIKKSKNIIREINLITFNKIFFYLDLKE